VKIAPGTAIKLTLNDALQVVRGRKVCSCTVAAWIALDSGACLLAEPLSLQIVSPDPDEITPLQHMTANALAGAIAQATIYPLELVGDGY
jgi:hypothetical protein